MDALMLSLMAWLHFHTGYDIDLEPPNITITEMANLCQVYGLDPSADCEAMKLMGFYNERHTIYLYAGFEASDATDQSRLLHELVHYVQWHNGEQIEGCWGQLEAAAYRLQDQWRVEQGMKKQADPFRLVMMEAACDS